MYNFVYLIFLIKMNPHTNQSDLINLVLKKLNLNHTSVKKKMFNLFHIQNPLQNKAKCLLPDFSNTALYEAKVKVTQSCPTLCNPMDYTVHGILQARILEWVAFPFSRGSSQPRDQTQVSRIAGGFITS